MELYSFYCPACGAERTAALNIVGRRVRCPICEATVTAPPPTTKRQRQLNDTWAPDSGPESGGPGADDAALAGPASNAAASNAAASNPPAANDPPFDPYYKWLAIPPSEHPPNYYRLLGVPLFEQDLEVIESSADRQMAHVKTQAGGRRAELSQKLLNELANACSCLLSPKKKRIYDEKLKQELAQQEKPIPSPQTRQEKPIPSPQRPVGTGTVTDFAPIELSEEEEEPAPTTKGRGAPTKAEAASAEAAAKASETPAPEAPPIRGDAGSSQVVAPPQALTPLSESPPVESPAVEAPPLTQQLVPIDDEEEDDPFEDQTAEDDDAPVSFRRERQRDEPEMDMTPMVDVTFLLLIFFMVTAAFALQRSKELPTPNDDQPSTAAQSVEDLEEDSDVIIVRVDSYNAFHVTTPDWEEEAPSEQELLIKLREARLGDSAGNVPTQLLVIANGEALYERVITALDAGPAVGMERVKLVTVEEDDE